MSAYRWSPRFMSALASGASIFALICAQPASAQQSAQADQPAAAAGVGLDEIVVTARRKEEKAQTVPISLETFTQSSISEQGIVNGFDFQRTTPGYMASIATGATVQRQFIRGVQGTVGYFNGAPEFTAADLQMFFDVSNIQLLKGPQGTLFGIAANGGAIVVEPKKPTNDFGGFAEVTLGNYGRNTVQGALNIPVVEDKVLVRLAGEKSHTDGYVYDTTLGENLLDVNFHIERAIVTVRPTDDFQNEFLVGYYSINQVSGFTATHNFTVDPTSAAAKLYGPTIMGQLTINQQLGWYATQGGYNTENQGIYYHVNQWNLIDTATYDINDDVTVKNILSYEEVYLAQETPGSTGANFGPVPVIGVGNVLGNGTRVPYSPPGPAVGYYDELQVLGKAFDGKLSYSIGTFNSFTRTASPVLYLQCNTVVRGIQTCNSPTESDGRTNAVYGQATYDLGVLAEGLSFTGGYRYSWDKVYQVTASYSAAAGAYVPRTSGSQYALFQKPNFMMSLDYRVNPTTMVYVSNAKGYTKGGLNALTLPVELQTFQPESLNETEIGIKSDNEFWGMKTRVNLAAYYGDDQRVQVLTNAVVLINPNGPANGPTQSANPTQNAASAYTEGIDGEFTIIPDPAWEFYANVAYNHYAYEKYDSLDTSVSPPVRISLKYLRPQDTPLFQFNVRATYHVPLEWVSPGQELGDLSISATYDWVGINTHMLGPPTVPSANLLQTKEIFPAFGTANLTVNWRDMLGRTGLNGTFFITNLAENTWSIGAYSVYESLGYSTIVPAPPRMMGVTVHYDFGG